MHDDVETALVGAFVNMEGLSQFDYATKLITILNQMAQDCEENVDELEAEIARLKCASPESTPLRSYKMGVGWMELGEALTLVHGLAEYGFVGAVDKRLTWDVPHSRLKVALDTIHDFIANNFEEDEKETHP